MCRYFLILLTLFIFSTSKSQVFEPSFIIGGGGTQVSGDNLGGFNKPAFCFGTQIKTSITKNSSLGFRLNYTSRGSKKQANEKIGDFDFYRISMQEVEIPIFYQYRYQKLYALSGISFGRIFNFQEETHNGPAQDPRPVKNWEVSAFLGLGFDSEKHVFIEAYIGHGLTYFRKFPTNQNANKGNGNGEYNHYLFLVLGYKLHSEK